MRGRIAAAGAVAGALFCVVAVAQVAQEPREVRGNGVQAGQEAGEARWWEEDIWRDPERGFHYYPPQQRPRPKAKTDKKQAPQTPAQRRRLEDITDIAELRQERERRLNAAVMDPTPEKVAAYLEVNTFMLRKSALFADVWRRTVWENPEHDFNAMNPAANFAQVELRHARTEQKRRTMESLARDFGIVFFYRSDCPHCKIQAPVLRMLTNTYGMEVLAVSLDGGPLEGWPEARVDNGISMVVSGGRGVNVVPTLYLVSRDTRQSVMLGSGVLAADEIVERVHVLTQVPVGEGIAGGIR